ncbi:hypothetical protein OG552_34380 [Streptomyces sp. NBC_01476]|uniref:hypothetical protein n=1 Tax=Streptomyces sp. NBC_01476 TaxID=2903881 RepID=UPI002E35B26F|nr:hypothetical protein [Streptomyces sp. NBC_01476]
MEQQFRAGFVQIEISEFVDLCRYPQSWIYAETATMPTGVKTKSDGRWVLAAPDGGGSLEFRQEVAAARAPQNGDAVDLPVCVSFGG